MHAFLVPQCAADVLPKKLLFGKLAFSAVAALRLGLLLWVL